MPRGWQSAVLVGWGPAWMAYWMWPQPESATLDWITPFVAAVFAIMLLAPFAALSGGFMGARWRWARDRPDEAISSRPTTVT